MGKKSHIKIIIGLYAIETLAKPVSCLVTEETTMLLLQNTAASLTHTVALIFSTT